MLDLQRAPNHESTCTCRLWEGEGRGGEAGEAGEGGRGDGEREKTVAELLRHYLKYNMCIIYTCTISGVPAIIQYLNMCNYIIIFNQIY